MARGRACEVRFAWLLGCREGRPLLPRPVPSQGPNLRLLPLASKEMWAGRAGSRADSGEEGGR